MMTRLESWCKDIESMETLVETKAQDILTMWNDSFCFWNLLFYEIHLATIIIHDFSDNQFFKFNQVILWWEKKVFYCKPEWLKKLIVIERPLA